MHIDAVKRASCAMVILVVLPTVRGFAQELPLCTEQRVTYEPFDDHFASNLASESPAPTVVAAGEKRSLQQGTKYIMAKDPDYSKPGPWRIVVWIGSSGEAPTQMLTFLDHA